MLQIIIGILFGLGLFFILADAYAVPYYKTSKAVVSISKLQKEKTSALELWFQDLAQWLAKKLPMDPFRKSQLEGDLKTAQMDITPEMFRANAIVKAGIVGILAIPMAFIFPLLCPVVLSLAIFLYRT